MEVLEHENVPPKSDMPAQVSSVSSHALFISAPLPPSALTIYPPARPRHSLLLPFPGGVLRLSL